MATDLLIVPDSAVTQRSSTASTRPSSMPLFVEQGELHAPPRLVEFLRRRNVVSAGGFLSFLRSTPDPLQSELGWDAGMMLDLLNRLVQVLRGILPEEVLSPRPPRRRAMGARNPSREPRG